MLNQSIEKAKTMLSSVNNPIESLNKAKVDPSFLKTVKGYLTNPMFSFLLPMIGVDKNVALQKLDELEKMMSNPTTDFTTSPTPTPTSSQWGQGDDLERFKRGLNSFK